MESPHTGRGRAIKANDTRVAVVEHRGDPQRIDESVHRFVAWRKQHRPLPGTHATFNILHNDPTAVALDDYRLGLCVETDRDLGDDACGVVTKIISGGRCAVLWHRGSDDDLGETLRYLCTEWLPRSGERRRDFPVYLQRILFFPEVPESEAITEIFLPLG